MFCARRHPHPFFCLLRPGMFVANSRSRAWCPATVLAMVFSAWCAPGASAHGQEHGGSESASKFDATWPMERVSLNDGRSYFGLILDAGEDAIEMLEIRRPPGKPMFGVVLPIEREQIATVQRLAPQQREQLRKRFEQFKNRMQFEARRMDSVQLLLLQEPDGNVLQYRGKWFELASRAGVQTTRLLAVRLEQRLMAFRQLLPPRVEVDDAERLQIRVFGTEEEYAHSLRARGVPLRNPAYYHRSQNLIVAGSDVKRYLQENKEAEQQHRQVRVQLELERQRLPLYLEQLKRELSAADSIPENWIQIRVAAERRLDEEARQLSIDLRAAERHNAQVVEEELNRMLRRLYHEMFHAYLESYVYPNEQSEVPLWLDEGLAQVFESGRFEADSLRLDAPDADKLARLQADLASDRPLRLSMLLKADAARFLTRHADSGGEAVRSYLYAWGLAHYLTFERGLLGTGHLHQYVAPAAGMQDPVRRFELLIDMKLAVFEPHWRQYIARLSSR